MAKNKLKTNASILECIKNLNFNFCYDYEDLIIELKQDIAEFNIKQDDTIKIVRDLEQELYPAIIDYYLPNDTIEKIDIDNVTDIKLKDLLLELYYLNDIIKNNNDYDKEKH